MGRPSVQAQRKEQILDAFENCVARFGIEGATLERIADESGLARPLIRHHTGNRDDLIEALFERFQERSSQGAAELIQGLPARNASPVMLDRLFDTAGDQTDVLLAEAFIACSATNPEISNAMAEWVRAYASLIADVISSDFPDANSDDVRIVATGILGLHFNLASLAPFLALEHLTHDSKSAAQRLLKTLS